MYEKEEEEKVKDTETEIGEQTPLSADTSKETLPQRGSDIESA